MRFLIFIFAFVALASVARSAAAEPPPDPTRDPVHIEVGLRVGYAFPMGSAYSGQPLSTTLTGFVPLWADLGVRVLHERLFIGVYGQYGIGLVASGNGCGVAGQTCTGSDIRAGVELLWHPDPHSVHVVDPWLGIGSGYEGQTVTVNADGGSGVSSAHGWEYVNLQAGVDWILGVGRGGPFAALSVAGYGPGESNGPAGIEGSVHEWLIVGVRGAIMP